MRGKYVVSLKPSPAHFAGDSFDADAARHEIAEKLKALKGCCIEIIMKDISTVRYSPQRLWEWARIVKETLDSMY